MHEYVREAFYVARYERRPTVLGVPYDLQKVAVCRPDPTTSRPRPTSRKPGRTPPNPETSRRWSTSYRQRERPIIIAGRGAV